ncbi:MAG: ATP synthase F1 subunit delta [Elusimicrobia bacterium]|nr:ATP synthase F1 subunit delta [Elusimicrobiota bacterium]
MKNARRLAQQYAKRLFAVSQHHGNTGKIQNDLSVIVRSRRLDDKPWEILQNPLIGNKEKTDIIASAFNGRLEPLTLELLEWLAARRQISIIPQVAEQLDSLADDAAGIARANVRSAFPLTTQEQQQLERSLSRFTGKRVLLDIREDDSLMAGLAVRVGDYYFEHNLRHEAQRLRGLLSY